MNTYYIVPVSEYDRKEIAPVETIDTATEDVLGKTYPNEFERAQAIWKNLNAFLNYTKKLQRESSPTIQNKKFFKEALKEIMAEETPVYAPRRLRIVEERRPVPTPHLSPVSEDSSPEIPAKVLPQLPDVPARSMVLKTYSAAALDAPLTRVHLPSYLK